jgi:hypothetical protein
MNDETQEKNEDMVYTLKEPVIFGSETITSIELKEPLGLHLKKILNEEKKGDMIHKTLELCSNVTIQVINKLKSKDYLALMEKTEPFFPKKSQETEEN